MKAGKLFVIIFCVLFSQISVMAQVTIYEHISYQGKSQLLQEGTYTMNQIQIGNDQLSSVKVDGCWKVTLYEHIAGQGRQLSFTANSTDLVKLNFNDITSTIKVEKNPDCNSTESVELPKSFKVLAFSVGEGKGDKDSYWFALNNNDSRGRILSQAKLGNNSKWMEIQSIDLGGNVYAFKVINAGADMYLTARDNKEVHIEKAANGNIPDGAKFISVAPLTSASHSTGGSFRSFVSAKFADCYLRHQGFIMFVHPSNGTELFKQDASWLVEKM